MISEVQVEVRLRNWFLRKTNNSAVRRIGELPLAVGTDVGVVRKENQDRAAILRTMDGNNRPFIVMAVCDGIGGMADGTTCASIALAAFFSACIRNKTLRSMERAGLAAHEANKAVFSQYNGSGGATLSAVLIDSSESSIGVNIGDSRIYQVANSRIDQLSRDDTFAGQFPASRHAHPQQKELLQFVGIGEGLLVNTIEIDSRLGSLLITTDGIHFLDEQLIRSLVINSSEPAFAVRRLIDVAKWCGGHDNASLIVSAPIDLQTHPTDLPDVAEIWDPYGELQLLMIGSSRETYRQEELRKPDISGSGRELQESLFKKKIPPDIKKIQKRKKKTQLGSPAAVKDKSASLPKDPSERTPQLKVDFDRSDE